MYPIKKGATDQTFYFTLRDSTDHLPKTDITVTDLDLYYVTHKAAISSKADATALAAADSAHSDNKAFHVGYGVYRIDFPDIWSGNVGETVQLIVVCTGVDTTFLEVMLSPPVDVISIGGTVQTANDNGADINDILVDTAVIGALGAGLTGIPWNAAWDAEVQSECTDALNAYDPPTNAEMEARTLVAADYTIVSDLGTVQTGDSYAIVNGAHGLVSIQDDIDLVLADTNELQTNQGAWATAVGFSTHSAADVADAVWDEALSGHTGAGTAGLALATASSGGVDPSVLADAIWDEALAGHSTAGTSGKKLTDLINADLSGVATSAALGTVDTVVDAIKVVVDNIHDTDLPAVKSDTAAILTDTGTTLDTLIKDIPTNAEFNARSLLAADYTIVADLGVVQTADHTAAIADIPTVAEFNARSTTDPATNTLLGTVAGYLDTEISAILADTNELQTNQGNWATATGFSTHSAADVKTAIEVGGGSIALIKAKTDNLPTDPADESLIEAAITAATSPLATSAEITALDAVVDTVKVDTAAVKVQTDKMAFTVANQIDANIQSVNDVELTGDGTVGTPWEPV